MTTGQDVTVRYLDMSPDTAIRSSLLPQDQADALKAKALSALGIEPLDGETPLDAWLRTIAVENGLPVTRPAHPAIAQAISGPALRFMWFLA